MYAVGTDPGSKTYDLFGLRDGRAILEVSIETEQLAKNPSLLVRALLASGKPDAAVAPSGYGLPVTRVRDVGAREVFLMELIKRDDKDLRVAELEVSYERIVKELNSNGINAYILPGVIHLPTVPEHRKRNKIDMGTPDKVCAAALAIHQQAEDAHSQYAETSFILIELGSAYIAYIAVDSGKIVDGVGGTAGGPGLLSGGAWDGEVAYLMSPLYKRQLFRGGVLNEPPSPSRPEKSVMRNLRDACGDEGWRALVEGIEKTVSSLMVSVPEPSQILLSGRLSENQQLIDTLQARLSRLGKVDRLLGPSSRVKAAAQGAALLADGLSGGEYAELVEVMELRRASGTVLDHIRSEGIKSIRQEYHV